MPTFSDPVVFDDGSEPWSVGRGRVTRWLHCRVAVGALPVGQRDELAVWLADRGLSLPVSALLVTRGDHGYRVHAPEGPSDVDFDDLPVWMQRPQPTPAPAKAERARRR